jgi:competence protein ComGC
MCVKSHPARSGGFTRLELVVVLVVITLLAFLLAPALKRAQQKAWLITCNGENKQIGVASRIWAGDHGDQVPSQASITNGGWRELLTNSNAGQYCWTNFAIMREELGESPKILVCPADERKAAANLIVKGMTNIYETGAPAFKDNTTVSYFVGVTANDTYPQSIAGGDRNLSPGFVPDTNYGWSPLNGKGNDVIIFTNTPVSWSMKMHSRGNPEDLENILLGDGSVQEGSSVSLRQSWLPNAQTGTNFSGTNQPGIRLIFP